MDNQPTSNEKIKVAHHSWWICGILGLIIGTTSSDHSGIMVFVGVSNGLFWGWILGLIIDKARESDISKTIVEKIDNIKVQQEVLQQTKLSIAKYEDAKHRFQFLSAETLNEKYKLYESDNASDTVRLALEEELVKRGLLTHSPMHEKLEKINSKHSNLEQMETRNLSGADKYFAIAFGLYENEENGAALLALELAFKEDNDNINANLLFIEVGLKQFGPEYVDERIKHIKSLFMTQKDKFVQQQMDKLMELSEEYSTLRYKDRE